jgi:hypothetical protein
MPTPWENPIRAGRQLTIAPGSGLAGSGWAAVLPRAITEFNRLSTADTLGVTFVASTTRPDPAGPGGASVQFDIGNGAVTFTSFGTPFSLTVDGNGLIGHTQVVKTVFGNVQRIAKAFIFVPATPRSGGPTGRVIGDPAKLVMAVHEFIHACGLNNSEHSGTGLFNGFPSLSAGSNPAQDRVDGMPPIALAGATATIIRGNW